VRPGADPKQPSFEVRGASHRPDVTQEVDLIDEVARVRGLENIPARLPAVAPQAATPERRDRSQRARDRDTASDCPKR
jgi:phenylalanyl-tRNA synthetase beta subunit